MGGVRFVLYRCCAFHSDLYSVDTFFFPIWKGNLGEKEEKVAFSSFLALMQRELANPSYQSVRK